MPAKTICQADVTVGIAMPAKTVCQADVAIGIAMFANTVCRAGWLRQAYGHKGYLAIFLIDTM